MWFKRIDEKQIQLCIIVKPNAKRTEFLAVSEEGLHIALHAKPHQGEANEELIGYLAKRLRLKKKDVILRRGEKGRKKFIIIPLNDTVQQLLINPGLFIQPNL